MPRKAFIADLQHAKGDRTIDRISNVQPGGDDGEFTFLFSPADNAAPVCVSALVTDVSEYPKSHEYHIFAADDTSPIIASAIENLPATTGKTVSQLLSLVSITLSRCTAIGTHDAPYEIDGDGDLHMPDSQSTEYDYEEGDSDHGGAEEDYWDVGGTANATVTSHGLPVAVRGNRRGSTAFRQRIRCDLRQAKAAGFKVGHLGPLLDGESCYLSVSCRIGKLGISEEAMNAWQLEPSQYLILLIAYPSGYNSWDALEADYSSISRRTIHLRIRLSNTYKPTPAEATRAFSKVTDNLDDRSESYLGRSPDASVGFRDTFISKPLDDLMNERLVTLIVSRLNTGMLWEGVELLYNDKLSGHAKHTVIQSGKYWLEEAHNATLSSLVTADHMTDTTSSANNLSFPLVAMQFLLRHFVRCTEFCLVCHNKLTTKVEGIKPYVCDRPLCLYQYMSLGFGPSIEPEIIASPYVVDLLISFCYASAKSGRLKDFPTGLSLSVPPTDPFEEAVAAVPSYQGYTGHTPTQPRTIQTIHAVRFDRSRLELIWDDVAAISRCPLKRGDWIVIRTQVSKEEMHCRVSEVAYFPTVKVSEPVKYPSYQRSPNNSLISDTPMSTAEDDILPIVTPAVTYGFLPATFAIYDQNFDQLTDCAKRFWVCRLLDLLPDLKTMREYLLRNAPMTLSSWVDGISPAGLGLLRWIIASNRSCIIQVDDYDTSEVTGKTKRSEERVFGMPTWKQFRFAMGAPDKEQRFVDSVHAVSARLGLKYPTMFAWHGSSLGNWHGIIREGLHFKQTLNGRAFGDGCYHSLQYATSQSYSRYSGGLDSGLDPFESWPQSQLNISCALSLNEIVNAPNEFVSKSPHLVVAQLDWIQTRYLFVRCNHRTKQQVVKATQEQHKPLHSYDQDPKMTPQGESGQIIIPAAAVGRSWRSSSPYFKKQKVNGSLCNPTVTEDDDAESVATVVEDLNLLIDDDFEEDPVGFDPSLERPETKLNPGHMAHVQSTTDFVPGSLDYSKLPLMEEPSYATPAASKRLQKDFKALLKVQNGTPLHELGWYTDPELFDNVYQWIVELHSFEAHLPLTKDMKKAGVTSVVLELRFTKDYPMSPPFVRVIRPRFLSFMQGGGGHVTAGGALCMELLTNSGWSAVSSIESVLLQVRLAISSIDPKPARLDTSTNREYGIGEAVEAYLRACRTHGWAVPEGFQEMAMGVPKAIGARDAGTPPGEEREGMEFGAAGRKSKIVGGLRRMFGSS